MKPLSEGVNERKKLKKAKSQKKGLKLTFFLLKIQNYVDFYIKRSYISQTRSKVQMLDIKIYN